VLVHTFGPGGKVGEEWEEALCIPLAFPSLHLYKEVLAMRSVSAGITGQGLTGLSWSQDAALAEYVAEDPMPRAAVAGGAVNVSPPRPWAKATYSLDGFNSLQFVVDGLNACYRGLKLKKSKLYTPAPTPTVPHCTHGYHAHPGSCPTDGCASSAMFAVAKAMASLPPVVVEFVANTSGSVTEEIRSTLASVFPHVACEMWKLQVV